MIKAFYKLGRKKVLYTREISINCNSVWARLACWLLSKTDHEKVMDFESDSFERIEYQPKKLEQLLEDLLRWRELLHVSNGEIEKILVGADIWGEVCTDTSVSLAFSRDPEGPMSVRGIPIQFIPSMDGYLLVPKVQTRHLRGGGK